MALLSCRFPVECTVDLDKNDACKVGPFFSLGYLVENSTGPASSDLDPTVALVRCFAEVERIKKFGVLGCAIEDASYIRMQRWLVLFDSEHVVRFAFHNLCCDFLLATHCVNRNGSSLDLEQLEKAGDGSYLVGLVIGLDLSEDNAILRRPSTDHVNEALSSACLNERRNVLPSIATTSPWVTSVRARTHSRNAS